MRAARPYERRCCHPARIRRHDSICMAYVANTTSTDSAIQVGLRASGTWSERN